MTSFELVLIRCHIKLHLMDHDFLKELRLYLKQKRRKALWLMMKIIMLQSCILGFMIQSFNINKYEQLLLVPSIRCIILTARPLFSHQIS